MRALAMAAVLALAVPACAAAEDSIAGAWKIDGHVDGKDFVINCRFDPHGQSFGGACLDNSPDPKRTLTSGIVNGDQVKWTYQSHKGIFTFTVTYAGKFTGKTMSGTVGAVGHTGTFTGIRQ